MEGTTARTLGQYFLENGADALRERISDEYAQEIDFSELHKAIDQALDEVYDEVYSAVAKEGIPLDRDLGDLLKEELSDDIQEWLSEFDDTAPFDIIPNHARVEVAFVVDYGSLGIDDLQTQHIGHGSSIDTVMPNANFLRFLKLINMAPSEYIAACVKEGRDPSVPVIGEELDDYQARRIERLALEWQAVLDVERGTSEAISKLPLSSEYAITEWNSRVDLINTIKDYDRPCAISDKDVVNIVENASYGGVATFVARVPLKDLISGVLTKPFMAEGGFVGLHDFINGSGYIETPRAAVLIDPAVGQFFIQSTRKDAVDDVYGIVSSCYNIKMTPYEAPEWKHVGENKWKNYKAEGFIEIVRTVADDNVEEFWVQSFDSEGNPAGSRETPEVFLDLDAAKIEAESILIENRLPTL